jgi:type III pantothenate kinase
VASLLACADLGNSRLHLALFDGRRPVKTRFLEYPRFRRHGARDILRRRGLEAVCYGSVSPARERGFEAACARPVFKLGRDLRVPVTVRSKGAWRPGIDRLCNVLAAHDRVGGPCLVVDFGSAVNIEVVSSRGVLVAGVIAPGVDLMLAALRGHCEQLPRVSRKKVSGKLGRTTSLNIGGGVGMAVIGLVRAAIEQGASMLPRKPTVIATGGDADLFRTTGLFDQVDPLLTLRGAMLSYRSR